MATSRQPLRFQRPTTTKNFVHDEENCHENHPLVHLPPNILPVDRRSEWIETQWWLICLKPYEENSLAARKLLSVYMAKMPAFSSRYDPGQWDGEAFNNEAFYMCLFPDRSQVYLGASYTVSLAVMHLYILARQQSAVWKIFNGLVRGGFLCLRCCLQEPVSLIDLDPTTRAILRQLEPLFIRSRYENPAVEWLAVMITRGVRHGMKSSIWQAVVNSDMMLCKPRYILKNTKVLDGIWSKDVKANSRNRSQVFGMWLPMGGEGTGFDIVQWENRLKKIWADAEEQFWEIERVFMEVYNVDEEHISGEKEPAK